MGVYFNPNNESFTQARNSMVYVDKTGLIEMLNQRLSTEDKCIAVSHARRFGKSHAAGMVDAYYSLGCDSTKLFEGTKIVQSADFMKHMNKYNVIHLDMSTFFIAVLIGFGIEYHVLHRAGYGDFKLGTWILALADFVMALAFVSCSYGAPGLGIFANPK